MPSWVKTAASVAMWAATFSGGAGTVALANWWLAREKETPAAMVDTRNEYELRLIRGE